MAPGRRPTTPRWLLRWESLHVVVQVGVVLPLAVALMWGIHVGLLAQPTWRGLSYGIFWGGLLTAAIVGASRSEAARRPHRGR